MYGIKTNEKDEIGIDVDNFNMEEELKAFEDYTPKPTEILIRLHVEAAVKKSGLFIPNNNAIYTETVGYVAKIGKCCFTGDRYKDWKNWYKVGDWVIFPRHAGIRFTYDKLPVFSIVDDAPLAVIKNPRKVT